MGQHFAEPLWVLFCLEMLLYIHTDIENQDPIYPTSECSPQLVSDISELKTKFDSFVSTQPAPEDYMLMLL